MEGALPFRVEHPGPLRRARAGGEPRQVPLDGDTQLLPIALGSLCERDRAAGSERERSTLDPYWPAYALVSICTAETSRSSRAKSG
jgi:hypothetical protein